MLAAFAEHVHADEDPHLVLAGPDVTAVADDPEGAEVFDEVEAAWHGLPQRVRRRVHLALLPMDDADENAVIVNALQRRADVVVQKSLAEGFGLTVAEAMWKGRPVVASRRRRHPGPDRGRAAPGTSSSRTDLAAFGDRVNRLLDDPHDAERMGEAAADARARPLPRPAPPRASTSSCSRASSCPDRPRQRRAAAACAAATRAIGTRYGRAATRSRARLRGRSRSSPGRRRARRRCRASRSGLRLAPEPRAPSARSSPTPGLSIVSNGERSKILRSM